MAAKPQLTPEKQKVRDVLRIGRHEVIERSLPIDDDIFQQVYDDPSEKSVEFSTIQIWQINEENIVEYSLPLGFEEAGSDWIGIFKVSEDHEAMAISRFGSVWSRCGPESLDQAVISFV